MLCCFCPSVIWLAVVREWASFFSFFFSVSTFVGSAWSFGFFIPATTANDLWLRRIFYPRFYPSHLFSYLNSWERTSFSILKCSVLNKGTTGTSFKTSLVWRGPWLGIEPMTSRTRCLGTLTTRLSRRRCIYERWKGSKYYWIQKQIEPFRIKHLDYITLSCKDAHMFFFKAKLLFSFLRLLGQDLMLKAKWF